MPAADESGATAPPVCVATLNLRNTTSRWRERRDLLVTQLAELRPHVIGLQEVRRRPSQASWIVGRLNRTAAAGGRYRHVFTGKSGLWGLWEGLAVVTRLPILETGSIDLGGDHRVAGWVRVLLPHGATLRVHNAHLSPRDQSLRDAQARALLDGMWDRGDDAEVLVGDLNAGPGSPPLRRLGARLRSAHVAVHGTEPLRTWPTPLVGAASTGVVIDYVLVDEDLDVVDAWVAFDQAAAHDPTLFASDHFGVAATVRVAAGPSGAPAHQVRAWAVPAEGSSPMDDEQIVRRIGERAVEEHTLGRSRAGDGAAEGAVQGYRR
ncbi:MAG: endonuclease/exonuclease/phosphatase family protein [Actinomycetota bacterium]